LEDDAMQELQKDVQEEINAVGAFDIFGSTPTGAAGPALQPLKLATAALDQGDTEHLQSNWDDQEGYYKAMVGEVIDNRYRVLGMVGKGVFSTVLKCVDLAEDGVPVAMKLIRNNDTMRKAAQKELELLTEIAARDPTGRKHCVRLLASLEHRNHIGFVFEAMQMNLRDALKKFGKNVGINIGSVRIYARQLFYALRHLAQLRIVHADIKPDNILVSDDLKHVKICDFGSAFRETDIDNDPTPYLVSRFYRAPEIILGLPYNRMIDMWSVGTCLYELFTGQVMFPAPNNNQMLKLMMDVKGR
jgi:serine/threonine-protein kinase PRP4